MPRSVFLSRQLIKNDTDRLTLISGPCLLENEKLLLVVNKPLSQLFPEVYEENEDFLINSKIISKSIRK